MSHDAFIPNDELICFQLVAIPDVSPVLQIGFSAIFRFNGSLRAECAVRLPSSSVAAIFDDATAREISPIIAAHIYQVFLSEILKRDYVSTM
ncbi:hypothetical protein TNCT_33441 [Trichonephila clavata]|uniref:Uncharacterized protein n=1 Tax=Trichonephila clavata TaxID=2740835 RepID=A0A8X6KAI4_TRICU|nr:hypothetical protein TNCT_33441 [Trichonephila clavata]